MEAPLFPSRKRGPDGELIPITRQQADRIIKRACRDVGLRDGTWATHTLRKTWGYHAYRAGVHPFIVQDILGHSSFEMTKRYSHVTEDAKREAVSTLRWDKVVKLEVQRQKRAEGGGDVNADE